MNNEILKKEYIDYESKEVKLSRNQIINFWLKRIQEAFEVGRIAGLSEAERIGKIDSSWRK